MAARSDTKTTQTEEEEDYSHLTANDINFTCSEGIKARLEKFEVVNNKAFVLRLELDGKIYEGWFIEAINSFAPVNLIKAPVNLIISKKKRLWKGHRISKTRRPGVKRNKTLNVYSRENFPRGYVDTFNTIGARLRYGRDKNIPGFNTSSEAGNSSSHSKDSGFLRRSNRRNRSQYFIEDSVSNEDSPLRESKHKTKRRYLKHEYDTVSEAISPNENSSPTCTIFTPNTKEYNTPINRKRNDKMSRTSRDTFFPSETKMQCSPNRNKMKQTTVKHILLDDGQGQFLDINLVPECIASSSRVNNKTQPKNDDVVESETLNQISLSQTLEPDLITFSPVISTGKRCKKKNDPVHKITSLSQSPGPDLITFSPTISNEAIFKENIQSPSGISVPKNKCTGLNLLFSPEVNETLQGINDCTVVSTTSREIVSPPIFHKTPLFELEKFGDIHSIEGEGTMLNMEKPFNQSTEFSLQQSLEIKTLPISDCIFEKFSLNEDANSSSESEI